jgi:hypothetical protein
MVLTMFQPSNDWEVVCSHEALGQPPLEQSAKHVYEAVEASYNGCLVVELEPVRWDYFCRASSDLVTDLLNQRRSLTGRSESCLI